MSYRLIIKQSAQKELAKLPKQIRRTIRNRIDALTENPNPPGCKPLKGARKGHHRIRVGNYRVIYDVHHNILTVTIIRIAHRKDAYRGL